MIKRLYRLIILLVFFLTGNEAVQAQHYFFIEADRQQPFYLRMDGQLISSSSNGFLLVPKVQAEKLMMTIGFPRNQYPEQRFEIKLMDRDRGFQLKDFGEKGWGLFDRSSLEVIMPITLTNDKILVAEKPSVVGFTEMLAEVTGDSTLLEKKPVVKSAPQPKQTVEVASANPLPKAAVAEVLPKPNPAPSISGALLADTKESLQMVYVDQQRAGIKDTIRIEIDKNITVKKDQPAVTAKVPVCDRPFAESKDIRSLQRKILGMSDLSEQIVAVTKAFREKCFSCRQAMDIGWMFTEEAQRFKLFEAIRGLVSDPDQFGQLGSTFMKEEYLSAFKQLSGKN